MEAASKLGVGVGVVGRLLKQGLVGTATVEASPESLASPFFDLPTA